MSSKDANAVDRQRSKRVAMVLANPAMSSTTNWPVGFWWSELTHPWLSFIDAGYHVDLFSPDGGACDADAMSDPRDPSGYLADDVISMGFISTPRLAALPRNTRPVSEIALDDFDALVVIGGQAPMFTFKHATALHETFVEFFGSRSNSKRWGPTMCKRGAGAALQCATATSSRVSKTSPGRRPPRRSSRRSAPEGIGT